MLDHRSGEPPIAINILATVRREELQKTCTFGPNGFGVLHVKSLVEFREKPNMSFSCNDSCVLHVLQQIGIIHSAARKRTQGLPSCDKSQRPSSQVCRI
jgi:hypothetical protein